MKSRYWFISAIILLLTCSYFFYYFYEMERTRKIEEIFGHQRIHARQAARSFYELFEKWNSVLFYLSKDRDIVQMNEGGKYELNILLGVLKSDVKGITRTDKTGKIIYTTPYHQSSIGVDISKQKHMIQILYDHKPVVSDVFDAVQGFQAIVIHYPVFKNNKFDGTIALLLDFRQIAQKILDEIKIGKSGYAWMLSQDGIELYCPVPGHLGKSIRKTAEGFPDLLSLADKMLSGKEGTATYNYNKVANQTINVKKIVYFLPVKINNTFWSIAVTYSEDEITASLADFGNKLIIIFASIFIGGIFISYFGLKALVIFKESEARKEAEKELKESEERYRLISTAASDYMFSSQLTKDGTLSHNWVAGAFEAITGYSFEEYIARGGWRAALHPDDREQDERDMEKLRNNQTVTSEIRTITKSGKIVWVSVFASPVWDDKNNTLIGISGAVRDITKRKLAEEALRQSENKFEIAFRSSPDSISISTFETGKLLEVNEGFERLFGYTRDDAVGKSTLELNLFENPSVRVTLMQELKLKGKIRDFELVCRRKSGELRICILSSELIEFMNEPCIVSNFRDISERKRAEEALKESEFFLRKSQAVARIGSYSFDATTGKWKSSPALDELFGIDNNYTKDVNGWISIIHPEEQEEMIQYLKQHVIANHNRFEKEYRIIRHNNQQELWVFGHGELEFDEHGNTLAMIGTIQDITERKLAEEALKRSEERFRMIFEKGQFGLTIADSNFRFVAANPAFCKMLGYSEDELKKLTFAEITPSYRVDIDRTNVNALSRGEISHYRTEKQYLRKDGKLFWGSLVTTTVFDTHGKVEYYLAMIQDITELKHAEEELIKLNVATEQSPAAITITDIEGKIEYINAMFTKISGFTLDEIKGKYLRILRPPEDPEENNNQIWETIKRGFEWRGEYYNKKKDGTFYWESILISPIKDDLGNIIHFLAIQEDITEIKRTLGELILAKDKAEEANRVKNVFLANMSHELRTPLIGILGYAEMLSSVLNEQDMVDMARGIVRSGNRLLYTLNLILDLTRFESDRFELNLKTVNLVDEILLAFQTFKGASLEKKIDFSIQILQDDLYACVDERVFKIILDNLIHNAIKFTNEGGVTIIAGTEKKNTVYISINDTGIGIAKEHYEIIFEEFRQVSEGISRDYQGTGLGLSITKKYVEILGGTISVESQLGIGSTFTIRLPLVDAPDQ